MKLPCEEAIWYTLPRIRADLAREMVKQGMSQSEVATKLGITPAAVSQYLHKKRGAKSKTLGDYKTTIARTVEEIQKSEGKDELKKAICKCCLSVRQETASD